MDDKPEAGLIKRTPIWWISASFLDKMIVLMA